MRKFLAIIVGICLFLNACGSLNKSKRSNPESVKIEALQAKADLYLELSKTHQDVDGFILWNECDSLLFSGLYGMAGGKVNIRAAQDESGKWHRRSINQPECYSESSASTISRDMLIGLMMYTWETKDISIANDLFRYGRDHNWVMGDGDISRTYFSPGLQATLAELVYRLGGTNREEYRYIPQVYSKNDDYQAHLDMLHIFLRADLTGSVDDATLDIAKYNYKRSPKNPFYSYVYHHYSDGNQNETLDLLLNNWPFPSDRLPSNAEYCTEWYNQRDAGKNWEACTANGVSEHTGGDFLFVAHLLLSRG